MKLFTAKNLLIFVCIGAGILLLTVGNLPFDLNNTANTSADADSATAALEWSRYLESEAEKLCRSVTGVSDVTVTVTLSGGFGQVFASDSETKDGVSRREYVTVGSGSSARLCQTGITMPEIAGIGVVCRGLSDEGVRAELTAVLAAAFGIGTNRIYIAGSGR